MVKLSKGEIPPNRGELKGTQVEAYDMIYSFITQEEVALSSSKVVL